MYLSENTDILKLCKQNPNEADLVIRKWALKVAWCRVYIITKGDRGFWRVDYNGLFNFTVIVFLVFQQWYDVYLTSLLFCILFNLEEKYSKEE